MKNLNNYITEKLKINKNVKLPVYKDIPLGKFYTALKKFGELNLLKVFSKDNLPIINCNKESRKVLSLYILNDEILYSYFNKNLEYESELYYDDLSIEEKNLIYDYLLNN